MDPIEQTNIEPEVEIEMERRLQSHFTAEYGSPRKAGELWQTISAQLGGQDEPAPAQVAVSLNGAYKGGEQKAREMHDLLRMAQAKPQTPSRRWAIWNPAIAATLVLALGGLLVIMLTVANSSHLGLQPVTSVPTSTTVVGTPIQALSVITITNPGFEDGLSGWGYGSSAFVGATIDNTTAHSGKSSITMQISDPSIGSIPINQGIDASSLRGERVRLSGYIKTKDTRYVGLWMRVDAAVQAGSTYPRALAFDNMLDRPVVGTNDWQREDVVLDVPAEASTLTFGALLIGTGQVWADDFKLEVVSKDVPSTDILSFVQPGNMDFESRQAQEHWFPTGQYVQDYQVGVDSQISHGGSTSGHIASATAPSDEQCGLTQTLNAQDYAGKRVRFTAYLKTDNVGGWAGLEIEAVSVFGNYSSQDRMERRPVYGTTDWQKYEIVLDVPADSTTILFGAHLEGKGEMWIDDAQLEVVGNDVTVTTFPALETASNLGFENELAGWYLDSNAPHFFQIGTNPGTAHSGNQGAYIKVAGTTDDHLEGGIVQNISAQPYLGKRIRLTGYINAGQVVDRARLWLKILTPQAQDTGYLEQYTYVIKGLGGYQGGWTKSQVEMDVPTTATDISFGVRMTGPGEVWADDLQIEVVPNVTPTPTR